MAHFYAIWVLDFLGALRCTFIVPKTSAKRYPERMSSKTVIARDQQSIQNTQERDDHMNSDKENLDYSQLVAPTKGTTSAGPVEIPEDNNVSEQLESVTSANILCNYMTKIEYLKDVIRNMAFIPRYVEENLEYLNIQDLHTIAFPMTCFCDIPLAKVKNHMGYTENTAWR